MGDLGNILLAVCGIALLCTCGVGLVFILALRVMGRSALMAFMPLLISFMNNRRNRNDDDNDDLDRPRAQSRGRPSADSLRSRAQSLDFDSRSQDSFSAQSGQLPPPPSDLSRNRFGGQGANQPPSSRPLPGRPIDDNPLGPVDVPSLRGRSRGGLPDDPPRRPRRDSNANDDEVFGGMLDDDGDGNPDF